MAKKDRDAKNVRGVKYANMTNLDLHAESAKGTTSANMTNLNKVALIATVRLYANQDMTHITQVAGLEEIETTVVSAHIVLQIYFQMIPKH